VHDRKGIWYSKKTTPEIPTKNAPWLTFISHFHSLSYGTLMLLVGQQEGHLACRKSITTKIANIFTSEFIHIIKLRVPTSPYVGQQAITC